MHLSHLKLNDFRNYTHLNLSLQPGLHIFYGENAQGKTNLLEAVSMLATGGSFHAAADREVVNWEACDHIARLEGVVGRREDTLQIEIVLIDPAPPTFNASPAQIATRTIELPNTMQRKRIKINGIPRRTLELIGQMRVVLFAPTDLHLVDGPPEERRRFLDRALCQVQPRYCQALVKYRKVITQRAALLKRIRDNQEDPHMLDYLDDQLTALASQIIFERRRMIAALNKETLPLQESLSGGREQLQIVYRPSFRVDPQWSIQESMKHYREQLQEVRRKEILQGVCLRGPHRDDLDFLVNGVNMLTYGSRGQQRTTALSAKLAELAYMRACTGEEPVLLLDDVFSELDTQRREHLLRHVLQHEQVLLTATDLSSFPQEILTQATLYKVENGTLSAM
jgi:DNA replication and repair protein RecF